MPPMYRAAIAIVLFLILGLLTSIAIAWAAALIEPDRTLASWDFVIDEINGWSASGYRSAWRIDITAESADGPIQARTVGNCAI